MAYDILIKSGTVIDGTGSPAKLADIGINGDRIADVGNLENAAAAFTINASEKIVSPGFIDITNHSDTHLTLFKYPLQESMLRQGVTTIIGGNCGASLAPLASRDAIGAIRKWADPSEINTDWATVAEYLPVLENLSLGINFGTLIGYGTLRRGVIGDEIRILTLEEREQIKLLLRQGAAEGAFGLSLGLAYGHERISSTEEIIEIAKNLSGTDRIIKIHLRSEGREILASVNEAIRIGRETGLTIVISHFKAIGKKAWPALAGALELITRARASGLNIYFDVSPYRTTGSLLYLLIPGWARQGGFSELFRRIDDPTERKKIIQALQTHTLHYDKILITAAKNKSIVGHTLAELAEEGGLSPEETLVATVRANEGRVTIIGQTVSLKNTELEMGNENAIISSDGLGISQEAQNSGDLMHPRSFGTFPRFIGRMAPKLNISLPEAIKKATSLPAQALGLEARGIIAKKNFADLVIFDSRLLQDRATYQNPYRYPAGLEWVVVNGKIAVSQGRITGTRTGKILRKK